MEDLVILVENYYLGDYLRTYYDDVHDICYMMENYKYVSILSVNRPIVYQSLIVLNV